MQVNLNGVREDNDFKKIITSNQLLAIKFFKQIKRIYNISFDLNYKVRKNLKDMRLYLKQNYVDQA